MLFINLQLTYVKMLFYKSNLTSFKPSEYFLFSPYALSSILTLEDIRHGIKGNWLQGEDMGLAQRWEQKIAVNIKRNPNKA